MNRRDELAANSAALHERIASACDAAGRDPCDVTVVAVTKTWPASDVALLSELGVTDVGENRDQEAAPKARACANLGLTWHFVGQLQIKKCRSVASYADVVHSIDRSRLVAALSREAREARRTIRCLIQVDLDGTPGRGGVEPDAAHRLGDEVAAAESLSLGGVMAMAPREDAPEAAFARLADVAERLCRAHPDARAISAGMSGDIEPAIAHGATHVRIGTALLGAR